MFVVKLTSGMPLKVTVTITHTTLAFAAGRGRSAYGVPAGPAAGAGVLGGGGPGALLRRTRGQGRHSRGGDVCAAGRDSYARSIDTARVHAAGGDEGSSSRRTRGQSLRETMRLADWRDRERRDDSRGRERPREAERSREADRARVNRERDRSAPTLASG